MDLWSFLVSVLSVTAVEFFHYILNFLDVNYGGLHSQSLEKLSFQLFMPGSY